MIAAAADGTAKQASRAALELLCRTYWYPLYAFVRRKGYASHAAEDLTQSFFARLLDHDMLRSADPSRGRFRSFLLKSLENHMINERKHDAAQKRGGGKIGISIDMERAELRFQADSSGEVAPERVFDREWALAVLAQSLLAMRDQYRDAGNEHLFETLKVFLTPEVDSRADYASACTALNLSPDAARAAVHRLRVHYRATLREVIEHTLATPDAIDDEIRDLFRALGPL